MQHQSNRDENQDKTAILLNLLKTTVTKHNAEYPLAQCQQKNPIYMAHAEVPHFISNELEAYAVQQALRDAIPSRKIPGTLSVAILTGEAFALSRLPELCKHVDVVLMTDIHPAIHAHNTFMRECMQKADSRHDFMKLYLDEQHNPILKGQYPSIALTLDANGQVHHDAEGLIDQKELRELLDGGVNLMMKDFHFLTSEARYLTCKKALATLPCLSFHGNWTQPAMFANFRKQFGKLPILFPFIHISNVQEYDGNRALRDIYNETSPVHLNYRVMASLRALCGPLQPYINYARCEKYEGHGMLRSNIACTIDECEQVYRDHAIIANRRDASSPYHLDRNLERGVNLPSAASSSTATAHARQTTIAKQPWVSFDRLFDASAPIRYGYQFRKPLREHPAAKKLNDFLSSQQAFKARFVAYPRYDNESDIAAILSTTAPQARIIMAALTPLGIKAKQVRLENMHELIMVEHIQNQNKAGLTKLMATSLPTQSHRLDWMIQHNLVMKFVIEETFYSQLHRACPTIVRDIEQYIQMALQECKQNSKVQPQVTLIQLLLNILKSAPAQGQQRDYRSPLPSGDMLNSLPQSMRATPMSVLMTFSVGNVFSMVMDAQHQSVLTAEMERKIVKDAASQLAQFVPFNDVHDFIMQALAGDKLFNNVHWCAESAKDKSFGVYSIEKFTERQQANALASKLQTAGIKASVRQCREGQRIDYRVVIPDVPALAQHLQATQSNQSSRSNQSRAQY